MRSFIAIAVLLAATGCSQHENTQSSSEQSIQATTHTSPVLEAKKTTPQRIEQPAINEEVGEIDAKTLRDKYTQLTQLTADKSCDTHAQCSVVAVGSRACGGPSQYLVYSQKTADSEQVKQLAEQLSVAEKQFNQSTGAVSICQHLSKPAVQCQANTCVALTQGGSNSAF